MKIAYQQLWDAGKKAVLRGKFIVINIHIKKKERSQVNYLNLYLKKPEKEKHTKSQVKRRKEITKIRAEVNELENKKITEKINKTKSCFFLER